MIHERLSREIIGAAMTVMNALRPGLDEKIYENALLVELEERGLTIEQQRHFPVHYKGRLVGRLIPDLIVAGKVIVDPKVVTAFHDEHVAQMLGYLSITGLDLAILLNFRSSKLEWKRVLHPRLISDPPSE